MNRLKSDSGFIAVDMLIIIAVLTATAVLWLSAERLLAAQQQNFYRTAAVFLAEGELNELEYDVENDLFADLADEQINYNNQHFTVQKEITEKEIEYLLSVKVVWHYENSLQTYQQKRTIFKR
ncbi:MAG TPA: hypothetical protein H9979_01820 [Candidatus Megamonas gallistercoris]|nr:hypothetical protein [Candidatus Megamonas gallistercoris]